MCRKHPEVWIALLKASIVLVQYGSCQFRILARGTHILFVSNLQDDLVEWLFLIAGANLLIVVGNTPVTSGLLFVVAFQSVIEKLVVHGLDSLIAIINVQMCAASIHILCPKFAAVVIDRAFTHFGTDRSFHKISLPFTLRPQPGFCYSCQE